MFNWYIDITPDKWLAVNGYPREGDGVSLCEACGDKYESEEDVIPDPAADAIKPASYCWICE